MKLGDVRGPRVGGRCRSGVPTCSIRPRVHDHDPVRDGERLRLVVRDVDGGLAGPPLQVEDRVLERVAKVPVERRQAARRTAGRVGSVARTRANATRCCCPPDSCAGSRSPIPLQLHQVSISSTRARMAGFFRTLLTDSPNATLSATDRCGKSAGVWNTKPMLRARGRQPGDVAVVEQDLAGARFDRGRRSSAGSSSCRSRTDPGA